MNDAVGYGRYSTDLQNETSIVAQMQKINSFCQSNNLNLIDMYIDEAKSGTNTMREGYERMIRDAHDKKFKAIVIYDISRGSRDVVDWLSFRKDMRKLGITVYSATEKLGDISQPGDFLTELITVGIGQHQVLQSRQKSIDGKRVRASRGLFCGGTAPLGYDINNGLYVINEREAEVVRLIFRLYSKGYSYSEIANEVDKTGVRGKKGQRICDNTLYYILRNKRYLGTYSWFDEEKRYMHQWVGKKHENPIILKDRIPAIIDQKTWDAVETRQRENNVNRVNKSSVKRKYLLSGLVRCKKCGYAYYGMNSTIKKKSGKSYGYTVYQCGGRTRLHICNAKSIRGVNLEAFVSDLLRKRILNEATIEKTAERAYGIMMQKYGHNIESTKSEILQLDAYIENIMKAIERGNANDILLQRLDDYSKQRDALRKDLESTKSIPYVDKDALIRELSWDAMRLLDDPDCMADLIKKYIACIEVGEDTITIHAIKTSSPPPSKKLSEYSAHEELKREDEKYGSAPDEGAFQDTKKAVPPNSLELFSTAGSPGKTRTYNPPVNSRKIVGCKSRSYLLYYKRR